MFKKIFVIILSLAVITASVLPAFSADIEAKVYSFYTDNMLFKQNEEAIISGTADKGTEITAELYDNKSNLVANGKSVADDINEFSVSFPAPEGGFDEYSIILKADGNEFKAIKNVVFGELWLASGQSNMQYPLGQAKSYEEAMEKYKTQSEKLRVLITPFYSELDKTTGQIPSQPAKDIPGSQWVTGSNEQIIGMSAVAYFFANKMIEELDMPVGILNVSLGGTTIASWISREAIDSDEKVKSYFTEYGKYVELSDWDKEERSLYYEMSTNYNLRIEALRHFRLSGMIWYQGESDVSWTGDAYSSAFDLLQSSYTELFGYKNGLLPVVFTQLASFFYSDEGGELPARNVDFSEIQQKEPDSRALISIYDIPVTYIPEAGVIHPESKCEVGERMAYSAIGLIYNKNDIYTAATVQNSEIRDSAIFVTLRNVGSGLMQNGDKLKGFSVCGKDGIYVKADAEIINNNTVKIWNDKISSPVSAAYAYSVNNEKSNLYASDNGIPALPVSPFVTDRTAGTEYWTEKTWADCDDMQIWHTVDDTYSGYYPSWQSENAALGIENSALKIQSTNNEFSVSPVLSYKNGNFYDTDTDYSQYGKMSFRIKNNGNSAISVENIKLQSNCILWYSPAVDGTLSDTVTIPADNEWHLITFDLNRIYLSGNEFGISYSNRVLGNISEIEFCFSSDNENSSIMIDDIRFFPSDEEHGMRFEADLNAASTLSDYISAFLVNLIGKLVSLFR